MKVVECLRGCGKDTSQPFAFSPEVQAVRGAPALQQQQQKRSIRKIGKNF